MQKNFNIGLENISSRVPSNYKSPGPLFPESDRAMGGPLGGPVSGLGPELQNVEEFDQGEELSYYAIDNITSISDLV